MRRIFSISFGFILLLQTCAVADVVVIVRREAQASGSYVRICDIARVEGPTKQAEEVARTVIGPTPPRGRTWEITRWDIETRLYEMGIDARIVLAGNDSVRVLGQGMRPSRAYADQVPLRELDSLPAYRPEQHTPYADSQPEDTAKNMVDGQTAGSKSRQPQNFAESMKENSKDRIGKTISHYLSGKYSRPDIEIEAKILAASEAVPYSAHVVEVAKALGGQVPGKATVQLRVQDNPEDEPRLVTVDADTVVYGLAPVAAKPLSRDEIIVRGDVAIRRVRMETGKSYLPPREDALIGRKMKRSLKQGEPLLDVDSEIQSTVKQGDDVVHDTSSAGWRVTGTGKALGSGQVGDIIQVQDSATKRKFDARVTGPGTVAVIIKKKVWE